MTDTFKRQRIAISVSFQNSFFSTGIPQATYAVAAGFKGIGHDVVLVRTTEKDWYDDCHALKGEFPIVPYTEFIVGAKAEPVDIFIDVGGNLLVDKKKPYAKKNLTFLHRLPFLTEMEQTLFGVVTHLRDMNGVDALLTWSVYHEQDRQMYEVMYKKPVYAIPYNWYHRAISAYNAEMKFPTWTSVSASASAGSGPWTCHITETNASMASSSTIPMVIASQVVKKGLLEMANCFVNNSTQIKDVEFFKRNVAEHCKVDGLTFHYVGRQRVADWKMTPRSFVIAHNRFINVKAVLLDLVWSGIPVIHNSPWLSTIGCGLERFYYQDNDIEGACAAVGRMKEDYEGARGFFADGALEAVQRELLKKVYYDESVLYKWGEALGQIIATPVLAVEEMSEVKAKVEIRGPASALAPTQAQAPALAQAQEQKLAQPMDTKKEETAKVVEAILKSPRRKLTVGFSDMWDDFNPSYNFFTLLLEAAAAGFKEAVEVVGVDCGKAGLKVDLLFFGPFGEAWKKYPGVPKVHYTGENTGPVEGDGVFLNLGFKQHRGDDAGYVRLPLWMLEIDWFGADAERIRNPKPLPLKSVLSVDPAILDAKTKFCSFVVTNPRNQMRNDSFHWLSAYKHVDSAGRLFNNVGSEIYAGLGGGGGELKKHEFLKQYRFSLTYENQMCEGYATEKILHAKAAGCVPIYWGDPLIEREFSKDGFLNANAVRTKEDLIALVKAVEEDPERWRAMAAVPALDDYGRDIVRRKFSHVAALIYNKVGGFKEELPSIPRFLGADGSEVVSEKEKVINQQENPQSTIVNYITYASKAVLHNLKLYIMSALELIKKKGGTCVVFLGPDVSDAEKEAHEKAYPTVRFIALKTDDVVLADFADFWEPSHYAWKPYVLHRLIHDPHYSGQLCFYVDCGAVLVDMPRDYLELAQVNGIAVLSDDRQLNRLWCHEDFCRELAVTDTEKDSPQIVAGIIGFVAGSAEAVRYIDEVWTWAQRRNVIAGPKWLGTPGPAGNYGHRHDQSIGSIISLRQGVARYPLDLVYNDLSYYATLKRGGAVYVHRGNFRIHAPVFASIDEVRLINLERRADRLEKFRKAHPEWHHRVCVEKAVDGRALALTPALAALFKPNDFLWKKAIMGCALSHLKVWKRLAEDNTIENMLVLEDDVLFKGDFLGVWAAAAKTVPADWDVLYLGGVLPPNRAMFEKLVEPVNAHWGRIKENVVFGQNVPTRYFHFCNYAYVMRRSAAVKLLESIKTRGGYHTSADHMICNAVTMFKHYVLTPQVAGCYQDDDPKYAGSEFNNFNRIDGFDSDLWNNDERFSKKEIEECGGAGAGADISASVSAALEDVRIQTSKAGLKTYKKSDDIVLYLIGPHRCDNVKDIKEYDWVYSLLNSYVTSETVGTSRQYEKRNVITKHIEDVNHVPLEDTPIFFFQVPYVHMYEYVFSNYERAGAKFKVLHLSDEFGKDPVGWVDLSCCVSVIRNYPRADLAGKEKVHTIPLGWAQTAGDREAPWQQTPSVPFREYMWSFYGTRWAGRDILLEPLKAVQPYRCMLFDTWNDAKQLGTIEYLGSMLNSIFVACPGGQNVETFRFYEALECGAVPLFVRQEGDEAWWALMNPYLNMLEIRSWPHAVGLIDYFMKNKDVLEKYRLNLLAGWVRCKMESRQKMKKFLEAKG